MVETLLDKSVGLAAGYHGPTSGGTRLCTPRGRRRSLARRCHRSVLDQQGKGLEDEAAYLRKENERLEEAQQDYMFDREYLEERIKTQISGSRFFCLLKNTYMEALVLAYLHVRSTVDEIP